MATTQQDVDRWAEEARQKGATHLLVVCDEWDYEDYPVAVMPDDNLYTMREKYSSNMQRIMEVVSLR